ncbi:PAS domain-containing protein, partial [Phaeospirillum tilakii]
LTRRRPRRRRAAALAAALEDDERAVLVIGAAGDELFRNRAARRRFGPAADPLEPLRSMVVADETALAALERLAAAAAVGGFRRIELPLPLIGGGRSWLAIEVRPGDRPGGRVWRAEDISGQRAIVETLRRESELLSDFIDFLPVGCYSADADGVLRYVNQRLADWLGQSPDGLIGRGLAELFGTVPNPEEERAELRFTGRNGEVFQGMVAHSVYDEGGEMFTRSVVLRDPLPEQQWARALRASERRFRWLFDDAPVGIALVDPDGTLSGCNLALAAMVGVDRDDLLGHPVGALIAESARATAAEHLGRVLQGSQPAVHLDLALAGRGNPVAQLFVTPSHDNGTISGLVIHFIDATEQRNLERQFAQSQKMQAMGQLAGGVAHDFNNLLTAMIGFCDLLLQRHGVGDPSFADIMQVKQNANRAAALVRQLLAFSRRQALQPRRLAVTDALAELSALLRRLLGETIELRMIHGRALGLVRVDPGQFDQVIINLAVNARDAMPGGGTLTIRTNAVKVERPTPRGAEVMPPGDYVLIEVSDTGTGIGRETLPRIFEPFFSTKEVGAGTGLGLSTVYGIVRQTDGFVFVASEPGQGATFSIYLPRIEAAPEADPAGRSGAARLVAL